MEMAILRAENCGGRICAIVKEKGGFEKQKRGERDHLIFVQAGLIWIIAYASLKYFMFLCVNMLAEAPGYAYKWAFKHFISISINRQILGQNKDQNHGPMQIISGYNLAHNQSS